MSKNPRQKVADYLFSLGYKLNPKDISITHGGIHKVYNDTIDCWGIYCADKTGKEVEIRSAYTLTECARGFKLEPNTPNSDLYGDLITVLTNTLTKTNKTPKVNVTSE